VSGRRAKISRKEDGIEKSINDHWWNMNYELWNLGYGIWNMKHEIWNLKHETWYTTNVVDGIQVCILQMKICCFNHLTMMAFEIIDHDDFVKHLERSAGWKRKEERWNIKYEILEGYYNSMTLRYYDLVILWSCDAVMWWCDDIMIWWHMATRQYHLQHTECSTHPLASQFPVEIRLKFLNQRIFIRHLLHHRQCMPGASATTCEMWPSRFRVKCQPEFKPPHREALLQSRILSLGAAFHVGEEKKVDRC
jgi:hypothetical protein